MSPPVKRAERFARDVRITPHGAPLVRGADGAARRPYQVQGFKARIFFSANSHPGPLPSEGRGRTKRAFVVEKDAAGCDKASVHAGLGSYQSWRVIAKL